MPLASMTYAEYCNTPPDHPLLAQCCLYGWEDDDDLKATSVDEALDNWDGNDGEGEVRVIGYRRMRTSLRDYSWGKQALDRAVENLDDEGLEQGTVANYEAVLAAFEAAFALLAENYTPWACEPVVAIIVDLAAWRSEAGPV